MTELRCRALLPIAFLLLAGCAVTPINIPGAEKDAPAPTYHPDGGSGADRGMNQNPDAPKTGLKDAAGATPDGGTSFLGDGLLGEGLVGDGINNDGLASDGLVGDGTHPEAGSSDAGAPKTDTKAAD